MNLEYFKRKFDTLYKQSNTKRKDMAAKTGIRGEKITKLRKIEDATQPTVDDLIAISNYFGVTIDELIRPQEKNEQEQFENMGQIIQTLFSLDKEIGISIHPYIENHQEIMESGYPEEFCTTKYGINFNNPEMENFISEWNTVKNSVESLPDYGESITATWKDACIKKHSHYLKEHNYSKLSDFMSIPDELKELPFE